MSGRRLLDVAALYNASRGVAHKHLRLRTQQLDVYTKTSSLAKAVKSQTDRITETARAASFLASRLNETAPAWTAEAADAPRAQPSAAHAHIPSEKSIGRAAADGRVRVGVEQDHFYERSRDNSVFDAVPKGDLEIHQEDAERYPLPDGTIPPRDSNINLPDTDRVVVSQRPREARKEPVGGQSGFRPVASGASTIPIPSQKSWDFSAEVSEKHQAQLQRMNQILSEKLKTLRAQQNASHSVEPVPPEASDKLLEGHDQDVYYNPSGEAPSVLSSLPQVKIPKRTEDTQGGDEHVADGQINSDSYYSSKGRQPAAQIPAVEAVPEQETTEDINTEIFYSPRVAKLLGGKTHGGQRGEKSKDFELKAAARTPVEKSPLTAGKDQDTFNVRISSKPHPLDPNAGSRAATIAPTAESSNVVDAEVQKLANDISKAADSVQASVTDQSAVTSAPAPYQMRESKIPSSRLGRLWNYGGLAAGMFGGAISEGIRRATGNGGEGSYMLSPANMDRLVAKLSRMRGAALKLGQMMSFQDEKMFPAAIQQVLQRVQDSADYMPASQRDKVLAANLGPEWRTLFSSFEEKPLAAASIGQVHSAVMASTGEKVAVKVQYPGVASSIDSDLNNLAVLLTASKLLPKGLYLDKTIANARLELGWECDYIREAEAAQRFQFLLADDRGTFIVPKVYPEASGAQVLTMEFMEGKGVTKVTNFTQEQKDRIGTQILRLCLREITEFKFMQTDPNWTNFLYNASTNKLELLDFGASREYPAEFIDKYSRLLVAASRSDRDLVRDLSIDLRYLTGDESKAMLDAHIASVLTLAEPFLASSPEVYDFHDQTITERVKALIPVMIRERLAPPPEETYSLHRKLSGAFLLCARLGSRVRCRELFEESMGKAGLL